MTSLLNTKIYWRIRKICLFILFKCKAFIYKQTDKAELHKENNTLKFIIVKITIKDSICSALWAVFALWIDGHLLSNILLSENNRGTFTDVITCSIGVAGVILGLYCANISSMYTTRYADAPEIIAQAFQNDRILRRSVSSNISYIIFGVAVIIEILLDCSVGWVSVGLLVIRLFYLLVSYSIAGNRAYLLADVYHVADDSYRMLYRIIRKRLRQSFFSADLNFQNHFLEEAEKRIGLIKAVQKYEAGNKHNDRSAMVDFMCKNLVLIEEYWKYKECIDKSSLWFRNEEKYQKWHLTDNHEASMALRTGTELCPKREHNLWWFEDEIIAINHSCIRVLVENKDYLSLYRYLQMVNAASKTALFCKEARYYSSQVNWLKKVVSDVAHDKDSTTETRSVIGGIVEILSLLYLGMILDSRKYYEEFHIQDYTNRIINELDSEIPVWKSSLLLGSSNMDLYEKIATEIQVQGYRLTPTWWIKQCVAKEEYDYLNSLIDVLCDAINSVLSLGESFSNDALQLEACIILSRFFEYESKLNGFLEVVRRTEKELRDFQIDKKMVWNDFKIDELENKYNTWKKKIPDLLLTCSSEFAIKYWDNIEEYPDFVGDSFNRICDDAVEAIANNNIEQFTHDYESLSRLMILYQEYIRTDLMKNRTKYNTRYLFYVFTLPIVEWAQIGGLSILWGEFNKNPEWKEKVDNGVAFIFKGDEKTASFAETMIGFINNRDSYMLGIGSRGILETEWNMRIENAIKNSDKYETEYGLYGTALKTDSKLIKAFCRNLSEFGITRDPSEVFWVLCVNPLLPEEKRYHTRFSWEDKLK